MTSDGEAPISLVAFYWRPGCGSCAMLRRALVSQGVPLDEHDIWQDAEAAAFVRSVARGHETVPTVVAARVPMVNPSPDEVLAVLAGAGQA